jgi:glycosyltransferase involved in cell wall biosynthesis
VKVAIVQEWLTNLGGSERLTLTLHEIFPSAPVFTSLYIPENLPSAFKNLDIKTSFLQKIPLVKSKHQIMFPLMPYVFESFDFSNFDVVISSNHSCSKGIITPTRTLHICYCNTPTRYLWSHYHEYRRKSQFNFLVNKFIPHFTHKLRLWDRIAANRVDLFVANSAYVASRIRKYYKRESQVVYPPVATSFYQPSSSLEDFYLVVARLIPYKKVDIVIRAFNDFKKPLKIIGTGPEYKNLKKIAKSNIEFLGNLSDQKVRDYYSKSLAFIAPQEEDFGITTVESMASGRPVIAYRGGGSSEIVIEGITGMFFNEQTPQCLIDTIKKFKPERYHSNIIRQHALKFDESSFKEKMKNLIEKAFLRYKEKLK